MRCNLCLKCPTPSECRLSPSLKILSQVIGASMAISQGDIGGRDACGPIDETRSRAMAGRRVVRCTYVVSPHELAKPYPARWRGSWDTIHFLVWIVSAELLSFSLRVLAPPHPLHVTWSGEECPRNMSRVKTCCLLFLFLLVGLLGYPA